MRRIITNHADHASFFTPEVAFDDASRHLPTILTRRNVDEAAAATALDFLQTLRGTVHPVPHEAYEPLRAVALSRIQSRDPDDRPIVATALILVWPIWTEDQDFFGAGVATWTTDRVELYLDAHARSG